MSQSLAHSLAHRPYLRMNGAGNEIIVLDLRDGAAMDAHAARAIAQAPGLGFDQLMALHAPRTPGARAFVSIWNNDGSQAGACGNGTRCVAWSLARDGAGERFLVETQAGLLACARLSEWMFRVDMGCPRFGWAEIPLAKPAPDTGAVDLGVADLPPAAMVSMGNPHAVFFIASLAACDAERLGPLLERHPMFPERANISFAQAISRGEIHLRVWERGVGFTKACGSAACATLVAAVRAGLCDRRALLRLPGGELEIEWPSDEASVRMTGPVELEREGRLDPAIFAAEPA